MSKDLHNLADLHRVPVILRRNSFFLNRPIKRINQFMVQEPNRCPAVKHGQAPRMPQVSPYQLASFDCIPQYAVKRRYRGPSSQQMRATHNPGSLKPLTLTGLELNYLGLWNRSDQNGERHVSGPR